MSSDALTCRELVELVTEYFEGALSLDARARFERHIEMCEGCTHYLNQMRKTLELMGDLPEESIELAAKDRLLRLFRDWKGEWTQKNGEDRSDLKSN